MNFLNYLDEGFASANSRKAFFARLRQNLQNPHSMIRIDPRAREDVQTNPNVGKHMGALTKAIGNVVHGGAKMRRVSRYAPDPKRKVPNHKITELWSKIGAHLDRKRSLTPKEKTLAVRLYWSGRNLPDGFHQAVEDIKGL